MISQGLKHLSVRFSQVMDHTMRHHCAYASHYLDDVFVHDMAEDRMSKIESHKRHFGHCVEDGLHSSSKPTLSWMQAELDKCLSWCVIVQHYQTSRQDIWKVCLVIRHKLRHQHGNHEGLPCDELFGLGDEEEQQSGPTLSVFWCKSTLVSASCPSVTSETELNRFSYSDGLFWNQLPPCDPLRLYVPHNTDFKQMTRHELNYASSSGHMVVKYILPSVRIILVAPPIFLGG